jgi:hypothetical protein
VLVQGPELVLVWAQAQGLELAPVMFPELALARAQVRALRLVLANGPEISRGMRLGREPEPERDLARLQGILLDYLLFLPMV